MTASARTPSSDNIFRSASSASMAALIATRAAVASRPDRRRAPLNTPAGRRLRERLAQLDSAR